MCQSLPVLEKFILLTLREEPWSRLLFNMSRSVYHVTDNEIKQRLELALRPAEPPTLEEVLEEVSTSGVLRGPVDWVFPAWMLYVEYATQEIMKTFPLSEEEKRQLLDFRDVMKRLLLETWMQAKEKLTTLYKAVVEGTYRLEGNRLYAPDGTSMYVVGDSTPHIPIRGVTAKTRFPDVLKLPQEKLELFQLGWRASDEGRHKRQPYMGTTRPWLVFAWAAARCGELYACVLSTNLTHEGVSREVYINAKSWRQRWSKDEAISLVADYLRRGEWTRKGKVAKHLAKQERATSRNKGALEAGHPQGSIRGPSRHRQEGVCKA